MSIDEFVRWAPGYNYDAELQRLSLRSNSLRDLDRLSGSAPIRRLMIWNKSDHHWSATNDTQVATLLRFRLLEEIDLEGCPNVTDRSMSHFAKMHKLRKLELSYTSISGEGVLWLRRV
ncbi:MAG: hypothetical protein NT069_35575, partial [Planctomycetota bacterium]|nr:hypothetical protein [Planctomycetota bacterium]